MLYLILHVWNYFRPGIIWCSFCDIFKFTCLYVMETNKSLNNLMHVNNSLNIEIDLEKININAWNYWDGFVFFLFLFSSGWQYTQAFFLFLQSTRSKSHWDTQLLKGLQNPPKNDWDIPYAPSCHLFYGKAWERELYIESQPRMMHEVQLRLSVTYLHTVSHC